jgi:competence protein ComEC
MNDSEAAGTVTGGRAVEAQARTPRPDLTGNGWGDRTEPYRLALAAMFDREMDAGRGFLWLPVLVAIGILVYFGLPAEPSLAALAAATAALFGLAWRIRRRVPAFRLVVALAAVVAGTTLATLRTILVEAPVLSREVTADVTGWVAAREAASRGGTRLRIAVHAIDGLPPERTPPAVRITIRAGADEIAVGDALTVLARLRPPGGPVMPGGFDFARADFYASIGGSGFAYGRAKPADIGPAPLGIRLREPVADLRETIRRRILAVLPGDTGQIAATLVMGDQRGISERTQEVMRASGLGHVLAISGLHMALVAGSVFWLLRALFALSPTLALTRPIRKWAAAGALGVATFYLAISGANVATQRAYIMLVVILAAVMLGRRAITVRNVAIAALFILVLTPESLLTASFQMSFAATLALVAGYEALRRARDGRPSLAVDATPGVAGRARRAGGGLLLTSLIAGLATTPFAIYHFHRAAPLSLPANLAAMPVVGILIMPAALFAVVLMPFGLESLALVPMGWGIDWLVGVGTVAAEWSNDWGGVAAPPATALLLVVAGFLWLCLWGERWRLAGLVPMALAVPIALAAERPDILVHPEGRSAAVRAADGRLRVINAPDDRFAAEYWLRADADPRDSDDPAVADGIACDDAGCVALLDGTTRIALGAGADALADDCRRAEVVVTRQPAPSWCTAPTVVIDRDDLRRGGAHALYAIGRATGAPTMFRIETAYPAAGPRRPFMPPVQ